MGELYKSSGRVAVWYYDLLHCQGLGNTVHRIRSGWGRGTGGGRLGCAGCWGFACFTDLERKHPEGGLGELASGRSGSRRPFRACSRACPWS